MQKKKIKLIVMLKDLQQKKLFLRLLGTGISKGINFNEIVIKNDKSGKPFIKLIGKLKKNCI